jgi:carbonic anhydrase
LTCAKPVLVAEDASAERVELAMSAKPPHDSFCNCQARRSFLKFAGSSGALGIFGGSFLLEHARADALTKAERDQMSPEQILAAAKRGNKRFRSGVRKNRNYLNEQRASAGGQYPAAVLLSCIDSRAPAEVIMDLGLGAIFNCRVAGNIANQDILGSMEFACKLAGAKVALVMGHTACGAIKGAIDNVELGNLTGLLDQIKPAVQATSFSGERSSKNYAFVDAVARTNVEMTVDNIRKNSAVLTELERSGKIKIAGAMYDLNTGGIEFFS